MPSTTVRDDGLSLHAQFDFIPDRSDDRFLFCPVCEPEVFFCPIGKPERLAAHFIATGHDTLKVTEAHGVPEMEAYGAVKALTCKTCGFVAGSKSAMMKHVWEHKRHPEPAIAVTVTVPGVAPPTSVVSKVKSFLKRLP